MMATTRRRDWFGHGVRFSPSRPAITLRTVAIGPRVYPTAAAQCSPASRSSALRYTLSLP